jgi:hypothetical protein
MKITFIGNCQTVTLCFYFQELLGDHNIQWLLFGEEMSQYLGVYSDKVKNKIDNYDIIFDVIKNSDVIIYQEISKERSLFSNAETLKTNKKDSCRLIKIPSIHLDYSNYDVSIKELNKRELENKVDIMVSDIFEKYREKRLMLSIWHPNTFLFLELINEICKIINIDTFSEMQRNIFLQDDNYMKLPELANK